MKKKVYFVRHSESADFLSGISIVRHPLYASSDILWRPDANLALGFSSSVECNQVIEFLVNVVDADLDDVLCCIEFDV